MWLTELLPGNWKNVSNSFPKDLWVSRVIASQHKKERVYVTLNGYRWDDFTTYIYMSDDYGQTWKNISSNIPLSPVNVIKEDTKNSNLLYWEAFNKGLPNVAVHDIVIQPEANHILLGTHGRSIYKADLNALQEYAKNPNTSNITLFKPESVKSSPRWGRSFGKWGRVFEPSTTFSFFSKNSGKQNVKLVSEKGAELQTLSIDANKGFNYLDYDLSISEKAKKALMRENTSINISKANNGKYYLPKGKYTVRVGTARKAFEVK